MKKLGLLVILCSSFAFGQVKGDLATDGRAITTDIEYEMTHTEEGVVVFDIVVNMDGKVTSCNVNRSESTLTSTPLLITGKNRILTGLSFEVGYAFPKFHNGQVHFTVIKEEVEEDKKKKKKK